MNGDRQYMTQSADGSFVMQRFWDDQIMQLCDVVEVVNVHYTQLHAVRVSGSAFGFSSARFSCIVYGVPEDVDMSELVYTLIDRFNCGHPTVYGAGESPEGGLSFLAGDLQETVAAQPSPDNPAELSPLGMMWTAAYGDRWPTADVLSTVFEPSLAAGCTVSTYAILNPNDGNPGSTIFADAAGVANDDWANLNALVQRKQAEGCRLKSAGYVATGHPGRMPEADMARIRGHVDAYLAAPWLVGAIFLDEVTATVESLPDYQNLRAYIKGRGNALAQEAGSVWAAKKDANEQWPQVICDVGRVPDIAFLAVCDLIIVLEDSVEAFQAFQAPGWMQDYAGENKFVAMVKGVNSARPGQSMPELLNVAAANGINWVYFAPDSYWNSFELHQPLVDALKQRPKATFPGETVILTVLSVPCPAGFMRTADEAGCMCRTGMSATQSVTDPADNAGKDAFFDTVTFEWTTGTCGIVQCPQNMESWDMPAVKCQCKNGALPTEEGAGTWNEATRLFTGRCEYPDTRPAAMSSAAAFYPYTSSGGGGTSGGDGEGSTMLIGIAAAVALVVGVVPSQPPKLP
jgi:hypothetical protein